MPPRIRAAILPVVRCLIIDDNATFLEAARSLLEQQGLVVVGVASNESEGVQRVDELTPDVVLVDIDLGTEDGFAVACRLADGPASPTVILISTHPPDDFSELVDDSPAAGFIPKSNLSVRAIEELLNRR